MAITLIIEDGTGIVGANTYASADEYKTYHKDRGVDIDASANEIVAALVEGSAYIDLRWGSKFCGYPLTSDQGLEFPRRSLHDRYGKLIEGLPVQIKSAAVLYAQNWLSGTLHPTLPPGSADDIKKKKTVVGPITTEVEYHGLSSSSMILSNYATIPLPDRLCKLYTARTSGVIRN